MFDFPLTKRSSSNLRTFKWKKSNNRATVLNKVNAFTFYDYHLGNNKKSQRKQSFLFAFFQLIQALSLPHVAALTKNAYMFKDAFKIPLDISQLFEKYFQFVQYLFCGRNGQNDIKL